MVDDEPDARQARDSRFSRADRPIVRLAASGAEALETIRQEKPDVIISDIGMPDEDGYDFIRKLRRSRARRAGGFPPWR